MEFNEDFFALARNNMVNNQVLTSGVVEKPILMAMRSVPRHRFADENLQPVAYLDAELPLPDGRFLPQPEVFAKMLQLANVTQTDRVLDIGCGYGYSTLVIAQLAKYVVGVERVREMAVYAAQSVMQSGLENISIVHAEFAAGAAQTAPYDVVIFNGVIEKIPEMIIPQLHKNARIIMPQYINNVCKLVLCKINAGQCINLHYVDGNISKL